MRQGFARERSAARERPSDRDSGDEHCAQRGAEGFEPVGGPDREGQQGEGDGVGGPARLLVEDQPPDARDGAGDGQRLEGIGREAPDRPAAPGQQGRRDDQDPHRVADPPLCPGEDPVGPRDDSRAHHRGRADGRTQNRTGEDPAGDEHERVEWCAQVPVRAAGPADESGGGDGRERISGSHDYVEEGRGALGRVGGRGGQRDPRSDPVSQDQDRGEGDSGGRPEQGHLIGHRGDLEPKPGHAEVGERGEGDLLPALHGPIPRGGLPLFPRSSPLSARRVRRGSAARTRSRRIALLLGRRRCLPGPQPVLVRVIFARNAGASSSGGSGGPGRQASPRRRSSPRTPPGYQGFESPHPPPNGALGGRLAGAPRWRLPAS